MAESGYSLEATKERVSRQTGGRAGRSLSWLPRLNPAVRNCPTSSAKRLGFTGQAVAGGGGLLDHGGVLLGRLVHLVDRGIDLGQAGCLFLRRGGDFADQMVELADLLDDAVERVAGFPDQFDAGYHLLGGGGNQGFDFLGGLGRALRQCPHLGRDHREAAPGIAGAGGLDARH